MGHAPWKFWMLCVVWRQLSIALDFLYITFYICSRKLRICGSVRLGILDFLKDVVRWLAYQDLFWLLSELSSPGLTNLAEVRKGEPLKKQGEGIGVHPYIYMYIHILYIQQSRHLATGLMGRDVFLCLC